MASATARNAPRHPACIAALRCVQTGQQLHLSSLIKRAPGELATGDNVKGAVIIDKSASVGSGCVIGPDVSIGPGCKVGDGVRLANCVIMKGCTVRHDHFFRMHTVHGCTADLSSFALRVMFSMAAAGAAESAPDDATQCRHAGSGSSLQHGSHRAHACQTCKQQWNGCGAWCHAFAKCACIFRALARRATVFSYVHVHQRSKSTLLCRSRTMPMSTLPLSAGTPRSGSGRESRTTPSWVRM